MIARALALTLLHSLWQGALVAGLLAGWLASNRGAPPARRYAAACCALAAIAALPVVTFALVYDGHAAARHLAMVAAGAAGAGPRHASPAEILSAAWAAGAALMIARLAGGHLRARRYVRRAALPLPDRWQRAVTRLSCALGVTREVRIGESPDVAVPTVVGWLRPIILLPLTLASSLPADAVEAILLHELAHVRRHDYLVNALQQALAALLFYHPCVHWVSRVAREEREHCCDDLAVSITGDPVFYARALASVEAARAHPFPLGVASNGGSLMQRIERLLRTPYVPARASTPWPAPALAAAVLVALAVLPVAACSDAARTDAAGRTTMADTASLIPQSVARWMPELSQAGARWGVDPDLLAAITLVESRGDPDAVSPAGSVGLMQIMPATGAKIAEERGMHDYAPARLRDPAYNADFGAFYLSRQLHDFGSIELAAAAYNAGPKAVHAYLDEGKPLPEETRQYEARVASLWSQLRAAKQAD